MNFLCGSSTCVSCFVRLCLVVSELCSVLSCWGRICGTSCPVLSWSWLSPFGDVGLRFCPASGPSGSVLVDMSGSLCGEMSVGMALPPSWRVCRLCCPQGVDMSLFGWVWCRGLIGYPPASPFSGSWVFRLHSPRRSVSRSVHVGTRGYRPSSSSVLIQEPAAH